MRSAVPLFRTPATPWAMMRSPRRTAAAMPKRSAPLPSIDSRMASTLTEALSSWDGPADLNRSDFDASIIYRGRTVGFLVFGPGADVIQDVHEVDVAVVGAFVGAEVFVDVAVGPVFGAHVVEMVGGGELAPVGQQ